jgi:tetratricopeptide (TPR) repeat protein
MKLFRQTISVLAACGCFALNGAALAHEGPEHEIDELTERIKAEGESADLLLQRAIEYNVLNKGAEAVKDLQRALDYDPHSAAIQRELGRSYFSIGKTNEAFDAAGRGLKNASDGPEKASLYVLRAEISRAKKDFPKALEDMDKAIQQAPDNAESYLARSVLQHVLGQKKERIKGLEQGVKETGSGLLEADYLDALIDGGKADQALGKIEEELKDARLRSSWLIRRAKVFLAQKKDEKAKADLNEAIEELNKRLGRGSTDPLLLVDRAEAQDLLGKRDEAKKDYESARGKGVTDEWVRERIHALGGKDPQPGQGRGRGRGRTDAKADDKKDDATNKTDDKADDKKDDKQDDAK